ncbi:MAG: sulfurtransferase TusA family protein [bacterium]
MAEPHIDKMLDCTGLVCPMPLAKTNKVVKEMQAGQILEMIATDPNAMMDMEAWANQSQNELLLAERQGNGKFRFLIRKT